MPGKETGLKFRCGPKGLTPKLQAGVEDEKRAAGNPLSADGSQVLSFSPKQRTHKIGT
jgi:hypothetical protein